MRKTTRTRPKPEIRNPRLNHKPTISPSDNGMMGFGLFSSSSAMSSSSSSNLSPLAVPFTVERPNYNKFNLGINSDSHFSFCSNNSDADSIRTTATAPSTYSSFQNPNPITITAPTTFNRSSIPAVYLSAIDHIPSPNSISTSTAHNRFTAIGPNQRLTDAPSAHNLCSMNSSVTSGLEPVNTNPSAGHVFGVNPGSQSHKWSFGNDGSGNDAPVMNVLPGRSFLEDYGSSQVGYNQSLLGSKYSCQADGSQGKEDSSMFGPAFGRPASRGSNIAPSIIGTANGASSPATCHGLVSSGLSNEHTFTWNDYTSLYSFDTGSVLYDSSSDHLSPPVTSQSLDTGSASPFNKNINLTVNCNPLKESESYHAVGLISQVADINITEEVNSGAQVSEQLDHHNPGEDSPCWKGALTHFSSSGSQEHEPTQHPMKKLQSNSTSDEDVLLQMDQSLVGMVEDMVVASESLDVNMVVKALNNLSALLLRLYSKDECALKEQDHKALDQVIANLNLFMSTKVQQVDPAQKCSSPPQITSNVLREERNTDQSGKNIEELQSAYVRDESLPKDYNMVQKIKRVLDEDVEMKEDSSYDPLLYKNLWLEAEAELCVSNFKARLHRAKTEMGKSKALNLSEVASDIKKISTAPKLLHEDVGGKTLNTHVPNISLPVVDDVENSVMAHFNILKRREESNPINVAEKEAADVEASGNNIQGSRGTEEPHLKHLLDTDDAVVHSHGNQKMHAEVVDHAVMARLNILKLRGDMDPFNDQVSEKGSMMQNQFGSLNASSFGWEYVTKGSIG
ncbi:uncharacterized protein LOC143571735 isoform X2 [Bidens hawaiensis]|uniref:uncharacterized protein LOC143571735 isoform X2 n=1 Tax=Bidens hawaiensis TaxID=980011 RepID=UPI00404B927F